MKMNVNQHTYYFKTGGEQLLKDVYICRYIIKKEQKMK